MDSPVELEQVFQVVGRRKFQYSTLPRRAPAQVIRDEQRLHGGVHAAVHTPDALHEADGVPVEVVIDEPGGVLKVQAF